MIRFTGARLVDPTQPSQNIATDLYVHAGRVCDAPKYLGEVEATVDMSGTILMAGAIDLHTHIGGGKVNLARLLMSDESRYSEWRDSHAGDREEESQRLRREVWFRRGPVWSTVATGQLYCEMGYTACFEPAMLLTQARSTHLQLADTPLLDSGAYVVMGNEDWLLSSLAEETHDEAIAELVAWTVRASQARAVKVVNAGGISAFRFGQRTLDIDEPNARFGVTPRTILRRLADAVDQIGLPHPLHVHASNLGMPGNIHSTLATLDAVEGRRLHLTHAQFNAYTSDGPFGMGSGASLLAERINRSPELSIDVGQIIFGQTVTVSADTAAQTRNSRFAKPRKSILSTVECVGGCGVVPMQYECDQYVSSLQWTIGLELLLLIKNPYQVFLTTDHPNGGPFTSYPHLIRLLMDRCFRAEVLNTLHPEVSARSLLKDIEREYSLEEIAVLTRAAPARILGLSDRGHLRPGAVADLAFYSEDRSSEQTDWERVFRRARSVWKNGVEVMRESKVIAEPTTLTIASTPLQTDSSGANWRHKIESTLHMPLEVLEISDLEMTQDIARPVAKEGNATP